jgi:hypothetical protein
MKSCSAGLVLIFCWFLLVETWKQFLVMFYDISQAMVMVSRETWKLDASWMAYPHERVGWILTENHGSLYQKQFTLLLSHGWWYNVNPRLKRKKKWDTECGFLLFFLSMETYSIEVWDPRSIIQKKKNHQYLAISITYHCSIDLNEWILFFVEKNITTWPKNSLFNV